MESKIENAVKLGRVSEEVRSKHKGFSQWDSYSSKHDHDTILQVWDFYISWLTAGWSKNWLSGIRLFKYIVKLFSQIVIDGKDPNARDVEGCVLPTLVYLAREKRPQYHHNFKAGAMNVLVRSLTVIKQINNDKADIYIYISICLFNCAD